MQFWLRGPLTLLLTLLLSGTAARSVEAGDHWPWKRHGWLQRPYWAAPLATPDHLPYDAWEPGPMLPETLEWEADYLPDDACCGDNPAAVPSPSPAPGPSDAPTPIPDDGFRPAIPASPSAPATTSPTPIPAPIDERPLRPRAVPVPVPDAVPEPIRRTPPRRAPIPSDAPGMEATPDIELTPEISIPMPPADGGEGLRPEVDPFPTPRPSRTESQKPEIPKEEIPFPRDASRRNSTTSLRRPVPGAARAWMSRPDSVVR